MKTADLLNNGSQILEAVSCVMGSNASKKGWKLVTEEACGL